REALQMGVYLLAHLGGDTVGCQGEEITLPEGEESFDQEDPDDSHAHQGQTLQSALFHGVYGLLDKPADPDGYSCGDCGAEQTANQGRNMRSKKSQQTTLRIQFRFSLPVHLWICVSIMP